jgi:hypothetical protein
MPQDIAVVVGALTTPFVLFALVLAFCAWEDAVRRRRES